MLSVRLSFLGVRNEPVRQRPNVEQLDWFERQPPGRPLRGHRDGRRARERDRQSRKHLL